MATIAGIHHHLPGPGSSVPLKITATGSSMSPLNNNDMLWYSTAPRCSRARFDNTKYRVHETNAHTAKASPPGLHDGESTDPNTTSPTPAIARADNNQSRLVTVSPNRREKKNRTTTGCNASNIVAFATVVSCTAEKKNPNCVPNTKPPGAASRNFSTVMCPRVATSTKQYTTAAPHAR